MERMIGTSGPEEQHGGEFFCCFIYPSLGAEEVGNLEMPMGTDKNKLQKDHFSLAKGPGKEQLIKTKHF